MNERKERKKKKRFTCLMLTQSRLRNFDFSMNCRLFKIHSSRSVYEKIIKINENFSKPEAGKLVKRINVATDDFFCFYKNFYTDSQQSQRSL